MGNSSSIRIAVATHKDYWMPTDQMYLPVCVGAALGNSASESERFQRDNEGENISLRNDRYSELTALYWLWKNDNSDYKGLVHYRRYFSGSGERGVASKSDMQKLLEKAPVIMPKKRNYRVTTVGKHYAATSDEAHLDALRIALKKETPEVLPAFEDHMNETSSHICNMTVMRSDIFDAWCSWLFPVLEEAEQHIDFSDMTPFQQRVISRLAERLIDPWIRVNGISYIECPVVNLEPVNWPKKASSFIAAGVFGKKYEESF